MAPLAESLLPATEIPDLLIVATGEGPDLERQLRELCPARPCHLSPSADEALLALLERPFGLVICELDLGPGPGGLALRKYLQSCGPEIPFLLVSDRPPEAAMLGLPESQLRPAYIRRPFQGPEFLVIVRELLASGVNT